MALHMVNMESYLLKALVKGSNRPIALLKLAVNLSTTFM